MKIATLNINWFKKSKDLKKLMQEQIIKQDLDFLIVNENVESFYFDKNYFKYHSKPLPIDKEFQHLNYGNYLNEEIPIRTSIYSKHQSIQEIKTIDSYTSVCHKFIVDNKDIFIYGTVIGTWGIKYQEEIAKVELENFKDDIQNILKENQNVFIVGDFNTSFFENEQRQLSTIKSRNELVKFTNDYRINRATEQIIDCIDHIFISSNLSKEISFNAFTFLEHSILKDEPHKGVGFEFAFF